MAEPKMPADLYAWYGWFLQIRKAGDELAKAASDALGYEVQPAPLRAALKAYQNAVALEPPHG